MGSLEIRSNLVSRVKTNLKSLKPVREKAPDGYKTSSKIVFDEIFPVWKYRAIPAKSGSFSMLDPCVSYVSDNLLTRHDTRGGLRFSRRIW